MKKLREWDSPKPKCEDGHGQLRNRGIFWQGASASGVRGTVAKMATHLRQSQQLIYKRGAISFFGYENPTRVVDWKPRRIEKDQLQRISLSLTPITSRLFLKLSDSMADLRCPL